MRENGSWDNSYAGGKGAYAGGKAIARVIHYIALTHTECTSTSKIDNTSYLRTTRRRGTKDYHVEARRMMGRNEKKVSHPAGWNTQTWTKTPLGSSQPSFAFASNAPPRSAELSFFLKRVEKEIPLRKKGENKTAKIRRRVKVRESNERRSFRWATRYGPRNQGVRSMRPEGGHCRGASNEKWKKKCGKKSVWKGDDDLKLFYRVTLTGVVICECRNMRGSTCSTGDGKNQTGNQK
jgi:hypothetical protein